MNPAAARRCFPLLLALGFCAATGIGCKAQPPPLQAQQPSAPVDAAAVSARLHEIAAAGKLSDLRWPDFSNYRLHFENFYKAANFAPVWLHRGQPTPQVLAVIEAFETSRTKGLVPDDYDASRWPVRIATLKTSPNADTEARFDAALTVSAMRYISDLHIGRVNPKHFRFDIDINAMGRQHPAAQQGQSH